MFPSTMSGSPHVLHDSVNTQKKLLLGSRTAIGVVTCKRKYIESRRPSAQNFYHPKNAATTSRFQQKGEGEKKAIAWHYGAEISR